MGKKYSKSELKAKRGIKILIAIFAILVIISIMFLVFVGIKNNIVFEKIDTTAKDASDDAVKASLPIIINNIVIGATYNKSWIAAESYYFRNQNKIVDIDIYNSNGKKGKYKVSSFTKDTTTSSFYIATNNPDRSEEYIAVGASDKDIMMPLTKKQESITDDDINTAKKALGLYRIFNTSLKISSIHDVTIEQNVKGRIFCVTNEVGKSSGGYSAVIFVRDNGKSQIIKYNYVKDLKKSSDWPIYSFKFCADLNQDGINDIVIQETKEFDIKYDVVEYKNGDFVQVLESQIKM